MNIEYIDYSSPGLVRPINQDSIFSAVEKEYGLFAVADGMGGHNNGEIASQRLIDALKGWWKNFCIDIYDFDRCYEELRNIIQEVHESIYKEYTEKGIICGTTIALLFIYSDRYIIINSGDSRIYSKDGWNLKQESKDHVFGVESVISGKITAEEAERHPNKNKLTAAVGCKKELKIYVASAPLETNQFFICSDGVYKYCKKSDIVSAMRKKDIISHVSGIVNRNGASDNFSFISVKINGGKIKKKNNGKLTLTVAICAVIFAGIVTAISVMPKNQLADDVGEISVEDDFSVIITEANEALSDGNYDLARRLFSNIIEQDASSSEAYIGLANSFIGLGDIDSAVKTLIEFAAVNDIEIKYPQITEAKSESVTTVTTVSETLSEIVEETDDTQTVTGEVLTVPDECIDDNISESQIGENTEVITAPDEYSIMELVSELTNTEDMS